jgi:hypothetical protein
MPLVSAVNGFKCRLCWFKRDIARRLSRRCAKIALGQPSHFVWVGNASKWCAADADRKVQNDCAMSGEGV